MTSVNWTEDEVQREKQHIEEWGKSGVFATPVRECHGTTPNVSTCCAFDCCSCKIVEWNYGWHCYCSDGWTEDSWQTCMDQLEIHMLRGYHK